MVTTDLSGDSRFTQEVTDEKTGRTFVVPAGTKRHKIEEKINAQYQREHQAEMAEIIIKLLEWAMRQTYNLIVELNRRGVFSRIYNKYADWNHDRINRRKENFRRNNWNKKKGEITYLIPSESASSRFRARRAARQQSSIMIIEQ